MTLKFDNKEENKNIVSKHTQVILASSSAIRKQQMINADIPFEVIVSNADETPNVSKSFRAQLAEIAMRKADVVFNKTSDRGMRLIVAADQNIVFDGEMYGKPKSIDDARKLIKNMRGRNVEKKIIRNESGRALAAVFIPHIGNCRCAGIQLSGMG